MNVATRGGGASIRPTLSTTWLSRSLASEARRLDTHIHGKLGSTLSPLTKKHRPRRPCCSLKLNRWSGATVPNCESELVCSSSLAKKRKEEVTGTMRLSVDSLQHSQVYFLSSCEFPLPAVVCIAAQTARLAPTIVQGPELPIRRRSRRSRSQERRRRDAS